MNVVGAPQRELNHACACRFVRKAVDQHEATECAILLISHKRDRPIKADIYDAKLIQSKRSRRKVRTCIDIEVMFDLRNNRVRVLCMDFGEIRTTGHEGVIAHPQETRLKLV